MSERKSSEKYNDSCIKIFELIKLFADGNIPFSRVIELFADSDGNISQISNVLLNKYMNTLKVYGIEVKKSKNMYTLHQMPFSISLSERELYVVSLIKYALNYLPNGKNKKYLTAFIHELEKRYNFDTKTLSAIVKPSNNYDLSFYFMKFEKQIENCERCCQDGLLIDICYTDSEDNSVVMTAIPKEVVYENNVVSLELINPKNQMVFSVPIGNIQAINQSDVPVKLNNHKKPTPVIFKIKGDLAKRYKIRKWETVERNEKEGTLTVTNVGEDIQLLMTRLFKYGDNCILISPKYLKNNLMRKINRTLKNYE